MACMCRADGVFEEDFAEYLTGRIQAAQDTGQRWVLTASFELILQSCLYSTHVVLDNERTISSLHSLQGGPGEGAGQAVQPSASTGGTF